MSKGSKPRPRQISDELYALRYDLAFGKITPEEYEKKVKRLNRKEPK